MFSSRSDKERLQETDYSEKRVLREELPLVTDSDETVTVHADALCFRTKKKIEGYRPRIQVIKPQTIIEAITLRLRMWFIAMNYLLNIQVCVIK